jgi:hypothetical protein
MCWHYTVGDCLSEIILEGIIRPATAGVPLNERPITWFTASPEWEETANKNWLTPSGKIIRLGREETRERCGGLFRIGVSDKYPLQHFARIIDRARQDKRETRVLVAAAKEVGSNPMREWYGTFDCVAIGDWAEIDEHVPGVGWVAFHETERIVERLTALSVFKALP